MSLNAYHPETGATVAVTEGQLAHMRASGWMLRSEWEESQEAGRRAAAAAAKAGPAKDEPAKGEEK